MKFTRTTPEKAKAPLLMIELRTVPYTDRPPSWHGYIEICGRDTNGVPGFAAGVRNDGSQSETSRGSVVTVHLLTAWLNRFRSSFGWVNWGRSSFVGLQWEGLGKTFQCEVHGHLDRFITQYMQGNCISRAAGHCDPDATRGARLFLTSGWTGCSE